VKTLRTTLVLDLEVEDDVDPEMFAGELRRALEGGEAEFGINAGLESSDLYPELGCRIETVHEISTEQLS
jgi:hypothetical protein